MTHMYFTARAEGRISYGHLGRTNLFHYTFTSKSGGEKKIENWSTFDKIMGSVF